MSETARSSRLDLRVAPEEKALMDRAAALSGSSLTDFVRFTVLSAAREAVQSHETIQLSNAGTRAFVDAILEPPDPNARLVALAKKHRREVRPKAG